MGTAPIQTCTYGMVMAIAQRETSAVKHHGGFYGKTILSLLSLGVVDLRRSQLGRGAKTSLALTRASLTGAVRAAAGISGLGLNNRGRGLVGRAVLGRHIGALVAAIFIDHLLRWELLHDLTLIVQHNQNGNPGAGINVRGRAEIGRRRRLRRCRG